jgi:aminoglycoside 3-N-acetyltransferase
MFQAEVFPEKDAVSTLLDQLGVDRRAPVLIHSAFSSLGRRGLHPDRFNDALVEAMAEGTLLMPAMTWRNVTPEDNRFDAAVTPGHTGILGESFRRRWATHRSVHPTHSVTGRGPLAADLLNEHWRDDTPVGVNSPFARLAERRGTVLLLGVGLECCTLIHHLEERHAVHLYLHPPSRAEIYECRGLDGQTVTNRQRRHLRVPRRFEAFAPTLVEAGVMRRTVVGETPCLAVDAAGMVGTLDEVFRRDPGASLDRSKG